MTLNPGARQAARALLGLAVTALLAIPWTAPASGQSLTSGRLSGTVTQDGGLPLPDAAVVVTDERTGITRATTTNADGWFGLPFLPAGEYTVFVERLGHRPARLENVRVRPGGRTEVSATLPAQPPPVQDVSSARWGGALGGASPGVLHVVPARVLEALPEARREVTEAARLFSASSSSLEAEGLPAHHATMVVDGLPFSTARHPDLSAGWLRAAAFPSSLFDEVEIVGEAVDVELAGGSGAMLAGATRRGTSDYVVQAFGNWAGNALASARHFDPGAVPHAALHGGLVVSGPVIADTAAFVVGFEAARHEEPLPRSWVPTPMDDALLRAAQDRFGVDLSRYAEPRLSRSETMAAVGRFDWRVAANTGLQVRGAAAAIPGADPDPASAWHAGRPPALEGRDLSVGATLTSELSEHRATEVRFGYETSLRDYGLNDPVRVPSTRWIAGGLAVGADPASSGRFERSAVHLSQAVHLRADRHHVKIGGAGVWTSYDHTYAYGRTGEFLFAGLDAFQAGRGAFLQAGGPLPVARFEVPRYGLFIQDVWQAAPGLEITAGLRYDVEFWPADRVRPNPDWQARTGLDNAGVPARHASLSPRLAATWNQHELRGWRLDAALAIHSHGADPAILAEVLTHDGRVEVRRAVGDLESWPEPPPQAVTAVTGARVTMLGPRFEPPRTSRATVGVSHHLAGGASLAVRTTIRRTEFLPRRVDLNRIHVAAGEDPFGRAVYGSLFVDGGLVVAQPATNRRFPDFDLVSALTADGESEYRGVTVALQRWRAGDRLAVAGSYTYSRTVDNWPGARGGGPETQLTPFPEAAHEDWDHGTSDLDVPHRLVAMGELRLPIPYGPRLAAVYTFRSGYPFTPGFRDGVDVNGDGSGRNDPAFVSDAVPGVRELVEQWDCLRIQAGRFAERNACREPSVHALDLRFAARVLSYGRYTADIVADALNLLASETGIVDRALYLVAHADGSPIRTATGDIDIPLAANPGFGRLLAVHTPGRSVRLGFRFTF